MRDEGKPAQPTAAVQLWAVFSDKLKAPYLAASCRRAKDEGQVVHAYHGLRGDDLVLEVMVNETTRRIGVWETGPRGNALTREYDMSLPAMLSHLLGETIEMAPGIEVPRDDDGDEDPVRAAIRRARLRAPLSKVERARLIALDAEAGDGPTMSTQQVMGLLVDQAQRDGAVPSPSVVALARGEEPPTSDAEDPIRAPLATLPRGRPLSPLETRRQAEAMALIAPVGRRRSTEEMMADAREVFRRVDAGEDRGAVIAELMGRRPGGL